MRPASREVFHVKRGGGMVTVRFEFQPATLDDLPLLRQWQKEPHVSAWWDSDEPFDADDLRDPRVSRWIVSFNGASFAYMQDYSVHGWDTHPFAYLPPGSRGIDQYIGEIGMMGQGYGKAIIRQRMDALFSLGAPVIAVDPHPLNARAIAVYEKVGFRIVGPEQDSPWGRILPMAAHRE